MRVVGRLRFDRDAWEIPELKPHVCIRFKDVFRGVGRTSVLPFRLPASDRVAADLNWFMQRYPLSMRELDEARLRRDTKRYDDTQRRMEEILLPDYVPGTVTGFRPGKGPRPYQSRAIDLLATRGAQLLGDTMGLGKTVSGIGMILLPGSLPAAVVMEPHLQDQWIEKIREFTTLRVHAVRTTKPYDLPPADVYLFRYSNLRGWVDVIDRMSFGLVVFDEIQMLRRGLKKGQDGSPSQVGTASMALARRSARRVGMSGTPIYNYGEEVWHILSFLDPRVLGEFGDFTREWCQFQGSHWRVKEPAALGSYLAEDGIFLRRTRADVNRELPAVTRIVHNVPHDADEFRRIETTARQLAIKANNSSFTERGSAVRELDSVVRFATGVAKAKYVAGLVRSLVEDGERVLLAGWHRKVYDIWRQELADLQPVMYTGSESPRQKVEAKQRILSGDAQVMMISLRSGTGLDGLQHAMSTIVIGELDWSPGVHEQIIFRLSRDGQERQVTAMFAVTDEGSDPLMVEVLGIKKSESTGIIDPTTSPAALGPQPSAGNGKAKLVTQYLNRGRRAG